MIISRQARTSSSTATDENGNVSDKIAKVKSCGSGDFSSCTLGIVMGMLAFAAIVALAIWWYIRRRKTKKVDGQKDAERQAAARKDAEERARVKEEKEERMRQTAYNRAKADAALVA